MIYSDFDTEQCLLGSLLINNHAIMDIDLSPEDFSHRTHGEIYARYLSAFKQDQRFDPTDLMGVSGKFPDEMDAIGYGRLLGEHAVVSGLESIKSYASKLKELSRKRIIYDQLKSAEALLETTSSKDIISKLHGNLVESLDSKTLKTGSELHREIINGLDLPKEYHSTGLRPLDAAMGGGLYQGFTYGIAGAEKSGKTTIAHTISFNLGKSGCKHLYIALEMGSLQIEQKNISRQLAINSIEFIRPKTETKEKIRNSKPTENIIYLDAPGSTLDEITHQIGICVLKHGIKGFILDYWQLVEGKHSSDTEERHMRMVAQSLANYARKKNLWCILLAQMNKDGDLFGGGGLRKACDQLYFIKTPRDMEDFRFLQMAASRYTPLADVGSEMDPALVLSKRIGPYFEETNAERLNLGN